MKFSYTALDSTGKRVYGETEAENERAAVKLLRGQELMPIRVNTGQMVSKTRIRTKNILGRVSLIEKTTFIKNLAVMLKSGFPVSRALNALAQDTQNPTFSAALSDIASQVEAGQPLANAMQKYPKIFSNIVTGVVRVGESAGNLEEGLLNLAVQLKKDHELIRKTKGAMVYPAIVLAIMFLVTILMFTFVLPKLIDLFSEFNVELPLITRMIIGLVNIFKSYGILILGGFVGLIFATIVALRRPTIANFFDRVVLMIPVIGKMVLYTNLARFARTLASLLHSGMPILDSVKATGEALENLEFRRAVLKIEKLIGSGSQLSIAMRGFDNIFPPLIVNMVSVGEESGLVDTVLMEVAEFYEGEVNQTVSSLSSVLEPILMLIVGIGVGVLALGLVMPIYSITQSI